MSKRWAEQHDALLPTAYGENVSYAERHADGTGPFKLVSFEPGVGTELARNPDWWGLGQNPHNLDRIVHTVIKDPASAFRRCSSGEVDFLSRSAACGSGPDRAHAGPEARARQRDQDDLSRPRSGQPAAQIVGHQGQQPVCRPARAPGGLSGDRQRKDDLSGLP